MKAKKHIIYFHDIESEYRKAVAESARNKISELANKSESKKFKGIEAKTNDYFDYMWFVSKEECDKYGSSIGHPEKCRYIPIPSAQVSDKVIMNTESKTLLYVGDLTIVHNFLSMKWFVDEGIADSVSVSLAAENIKPNSSPITENIKSVVFGYKYPNCV